MPRQYVERLRAAQGRIEGERRTITILFADVKGSTAMAEHLDPEQVLEIMNGAFEVLIEPIHRYGGTLARLMGDGILAFFGAPVAHENDAERACRAALDIISDAQQYAARLQRERGIEGFDVRVGINTGLVVVGEVGTDWRVEYTAMGDAVNLAARIERAAEPGTILITWDTCKLIHHVFETQALGPLQVKGKTEPVQTFRLLGPCSTRHSRELYSPLVGRSAEMAQLHDALCALQEGHGSTLAITGEAGLGKSRLIREAHRSLPPGVTWIEGRCLSYQQGMGYWTVRQILHDLAGVKAGASPAEVGATLQKSVESLFPENAAEVYPYLARLLNLPLDGALAERFKRLEAGVLQRQIVWSFCEYVRAHARIQPLVLAWEDLCCIDSSSLDMLEALLPLADEAPLLMLLVFRSGDHRVDDLRQRLVRHGGNHYHEIQLTPLSSVESVWLLDNLLRGGELPEETRQQILARSEGNPFFLEEMLRSWLDACRVTRQQDQAGWGGAGQAHVPDTLQSVITARIDRLSPQDRYVLQTASVIGRIFQKSVLAHVLNAEMVGYNLDESLAELCRREFIGLRTDEEFVFMHHLTLEVTYNSLLIAHRKVLHERVGEAIEARFPDRVEELAATVAHHFEQACNDDKALGYWVRAADFSARLYATQEAIRCYRRALDVADRANLPSSRLICVHEGLGDAHYLTADYELALQHYEQALQQAVDSRQRMMLYRKMGQVCEKSGKYDRAVACFKAGVKEMRELIDLEEAAHIYAGLGLAYYRRGELDAALEVCTLALDLAEREGDEWGVAQACNSLGIVYGSRDDWSQAIAFQLRCMSIQEKLDEPFGLAASHNNLGLIYGWQGDAEQAIQHFQESLRLFEKIGNRHGLARVHDNLSQVYMNRGEKDKAMEYLMKAVAFLAEIGVDGAHIIPEMWQSGAW